MIRQEVMQSIKAEAPFQPYTTEELALLYNITDKTFLKWIVPFKEQLGKRVGWYFNIKQVIIIFDNLGRPEKTPR